MKINSMRGGLMATTTLCGLFSGLLVPAVVATLATSLPTTALAQDYTSGTMLGTVTDANGAPIAGADVKVKSLGTGIERTTTTDASGSFRVPLIPIGSYSVTISKSGFETTTDDSVSVVLGSNSSFGFTLAASSGAGEIVVKAKARPKLDFSPTATGVVIDVDTLSKQIPIARNVTALTLLAPSAVAGDSAFGAGATAQGLSQASISGASVGENVFYVNGLNITNFVNGIGAASVPFDFYKTIEVKTGGYQAEYGRGTGGVVNAVTKSGSNTFTWGVHANFQPDSLRGHTPNTVSGNVTGAVGSRVNADLTDYTVEAGGPIIKDKLFFYGLYQLPSSTTTTATSAGNTYQETKYNDPVWAVKLDGYLTSTQHFELTAFDTTQQRASAQYAYTPATDTIGAYRTTAIQNFGGLSYVGRYTGNIFDWLTVSAAYGDTKFAQSNYNSLVSTPLIQDTRSGSTVTISPQSSSAGNAISDAERKFYRADADIFFDFIGKHHIRMGFDHEETIFNNITTRNGGQNWTYRTAGAGNSLGLAVGQQYVQLRTFNGGGSFTGENDSMYIQDSWDVTSRLNLTIGYRVDDFVEKDAIGQDFSVLKDNKAWRLGFAYDPSGDKTDKFYGFYGRYFLPVAANTAFRAASNNLDVTQSFLPAGGGTTFGALDSVGKPVAGLGAILVRGVNSTAGALAACKQLFLDRGIIPVPVGTLACQVGSGGIPPSPESISALNVEATSEDEFILGYERRFNSLWKAGVSLTYRKLNTAADDLAIDAAVNAYCASKGIVGCGSIWTGTHQYLIANPGKDVVAVLSDLLPGETTVRTLSLSAKDLGFPLVKREYKSLQFTFSRAFDGKWGIQGSYTLSSSKGNFEGAVKSDTGQADAGITSDFDLIGFTDGAYGYLPNHHAHQFKVWGSYQLTDDILLGGNFSSVSGRKYGCNGPVPVSRDPDQISTFYNPPPGHYCFGKLTPRGESFETDWINKIDLSVRYSVPKSIVPSGNLILRADVFNVLDTQGVTEANETGQLSSGAANATYKQAVNYQTPRFIRFGFDWNF